MKSETGKKVLIIRNILIALEVIFVCLAVFGLLGSLGRVGESMATGLVLLICVVVYIILAYVTWIVMTGFSETIDLAASNQAGLKDAKEKLRKMVRKD